VIVNHSTEQSTKAQWLRWTAPPGVSIAVHAILISGVAYIGMQISTQASTEDDRPIVELSLPAPSDIPDAPDPETTAQENQSSNTATSFTKSTTYTAVDRIETAAAELGTLEYTKPAMDPVALEAIERTNAQIAQPESATPPSVQFAGVQSRSARKIVYVVDGSGATANSFAYLQTQLLNSISRLSSTQKFQVVLFRSFDDNSVSLAPINSNRIARATPANKQAVADWLSTVNARGRSNPLDGLRTALQLKPDLVMLITRSIERTEMGWAQGQREILSELNDLNPQNPVSGRRKTIIKTIQLLDEDPTGIMQAIGMMHGDQHKDAGENYKVVEYEDLIASDEPTDLSTRSIGASNEQRIATASELIGSLTSSGTSFATFYSYPDLEQRESALQIAKQIRSLVKPLSEIDGRAAILDAQAVLLLDLASERSPIREEELESIVSSLDSVMYTEPNTDTQRVLMVALAMYQLNETDTARMNASELLLVADDLELDPSTKAQAVLSLISMGDESEQVSSLLEEPPFITQSGAIDAVWGILAREAITKSRLELERENPWTPMVDLRNAARSNASIQNYIDTRITLLLESTPATQADAQLPFGVLLAAANTFSHKAEHRERAMDLLSRIAEQEDQPEHASAALWQLGVLGRAMNTPDSQKQSTNALMELAQRYPKSTHAQDAIAGAIHGTPTHLESLLKDRLSFAVAEFSDHSQIDFWRLSLAELLTGFARLDVLDPITPGTREGVLAGELYEQTVLGMLDQFSDPQIRSGLGIRMRDAANRFSISGASMWTKRAAIDEMKLDPESALSTINQLIDETNQQGASTTELELMRAQALNRLGQTRAAFDALNDLSTRIDATGNHTSTYWQAWALMLETISKSGTQHDKTDALRHIGRLELLDPNLGGSPWRQRITSVRETLHSSP